MNKTKIIRGTFLLAGMLLLGCGSHEKHDHAAESSKATSPEAGEPAHGEEIVWHEKEARAAGVRTEVVTPGPFSPVYKVSGTIQSAVGDEQVVSATAAGLVSLPGNGFPDGTAVRSGQVLVRLSARELTDGDPAEKARLDYEAAHREWERAQALSQDKLISDRELEEARLRYATAKAAVAGTVGRQVAGGIQVTAPISGYVKQCLVNAGEYVALGQPLMVITQNRRLRLQAEVPASSAAWLSTVRSAHFRTASSEEVLRLDSLNGRLLSTGRTLAPGAFYLPVTFEFDNVGSVLPGSYAEVWLLGAERPSVLTLPRQALTEEQGLYFVYVQEDADSYRRQEVVLGDDDGISVEIRSGLRGGERVVTQGAVRVKLVGASAAIPAHNHNH